MIFSAGLMVQILCVIGLTTWLSHLLPQVLYKLFGGQIRQVQDLHTTVSPRLGGLAIIGGCAFFFLLSPQETFGVKIFSLSVLGFIIGFADDVIGHIKPRIRLTLLVLLALLVTLNSYKLSRVDIGPVDEVLSQSDFIPIILTIFVIVSFANSINLIDGLNGLASGISFSMLAGLASIAALSGYHHFVEVSLFTACGVFGFLLINFVSGRIFLGDVGAYFLGLMVVQMVIALNAEIPSVSSWCYLAISAYPITETVFSIIRRVIKGHPWYLADRDHFHHRLYDFIHVIILRRNQHSLIGNSLASLFCNFLNIGVIIFAVYFRSDMSKLKWLIIVVIASYLVGYIFLGRSLRGKGCRPSY